MVGLVQPNEGHVILGDRDITVEPMYRRARMGVSYLAQEPSSFRRLSVEDNIWLILGGPRRCPVANDGASRSRERWPPNPPSSSSTSRSPVSTPLPYSIFNASSDVFLITDHNVRETLKITDRAYIIKDGKIFAAGGPVDLSENRDVRRIYLGEDFEL